MNVDDGIRGRMARAPAIFAKGHVVAPAPYHIPQSPGKRGKPSKWNLQKTTSPIRPQIGTHNDQHAQEIRPFSF